MARIEKILTDYGEPVQVHNYVEQATASPYLQAAKGFAPPVTVRGIVALERTADLVSLIGQDSDFEAAATFGRTHLAAAYPLATEPTTAITQADEVSVAGKRWRVISAHITGRVEGVAHLLVLALKTRQGKRDVEVL